MSEKINTYKEIYTLYEIFPRDTKILDKEKLYVDFFFKQAQPLVDVFSIPPGLILGSLNTPD